MKPLHDTASNVFFKVLLYTLLIVLDPYWELWTLGQLSHTCVGNCGRSANCPTPVWGTVDAQSYPTPVRSVLYLCSAGFPKCTVLY